MKNDQQASEKFPEQNAPEKNTDKAFVKVGEDGSPVIPGGKEESKENVNEQQADEETLGIP